MVQLLGPSICPTRSARDSKWRDLRLNSKLSSGCFAPRQKPRASRSCRSGETAEMMGPCLPKISLSSAFRDGLLEWEVQSDVRYPCPVGYCVPEWPVGEGRRVAASLSLPGVAERFAGQGIAQRLVAECVANGAHEGYRVAVTEATNRTSQHVFRKQALVERVKRSYRDYRFERQAVSASIAEQGGPR